MYNHEIIIIGTGIAGLSCAKILDKNHKRFIAFESESCVGGRISTDIVRDHILDRGFQVFVKGYPFYKNIIDIDKLVLYSFKPGSLIRINNQFHQVIDPFRDIISGMKSIFTPIGSFFDKVKILKLRINLLFQNTKILNDNVSTYDYLKQKGFSDVIIKNFFIPFFGSVLLDNKLSTVKSTFETIYKAMSIDRIGLLENGIGDFPKSIYETLPKHQFSFNSKVTSVEDHKVVFDDGSSLTAETIVVATDGTTASDLTKVFEPPLYCSTTCLYFLTSKKIIEDPIIITNAGDGLINTICCLTNINPNYSKQNLISVNVNQIFPDISKNKLVEMIISELTSWFPKGINFEFIKLYEIPNALPKLTPVQFKSMKQIPQGKDGIYYCGDYLYGASVNDAIKSGVVVAESILSLT